MKDEYCKLCLNLGKVRAGLRQKKMTRKQLTEKIGLKDHHTLAYYFKHPDKISLAYVSSIAKALGALPHTYDEYVVRVNSEEELRSLVSGERDHESEQWI